MNKATLSIFICFIFLSCKKEIKEVIVVTPAVSTAFELKVDQVINDSTIVLKWSKYIGGFQKCRLIRNSAYIKDGRFTSFTETVDSSTDVNHLSFTETKMPFTRDIDYDLYVSKDTTTQLGQGFQGVAHVAYQRKNSLLFAVPTDILINKQQQRLYIIEEGKITLYNYSTNQVISSKDFPLGMGYCSLGDFEGANELYVPLNDGWLNILDAVTLQLKDRIYIAGYFIGSVVAVNEKLYVSSSDMTTGSYDNRVKVYSRATKNLIGRTGYWDGTRLIYLENTNSEMIDITINVLPTDLSYYQFNTAGVPVLKKQDSYHGDYPMNVDIVRSFPDGSKFITSSSGSIFNKALIFDHYLKQYGSYSDFAFNNDGSLIYAANSLKQKSMLFLTRQIQLSAATQLTSIHIKSFATAIH